MSQSPSGSSRSSRSFDLVDGHLGLHEHGATRQRFDHRLLAVELVDDLADQLLDEVLEGDEPGGPAVLVDDDGHVERAGLHLAQQLGDPLGLGDELGGAHEGEHGLVGTPVALGPHEVLGVTTPTMSSMPSPSTGIRL